MTGLWFDGQAHFGETLAAQACEKPLPVFRTAARWLDLYFSGRVPDFTPPLRPRGTAFRRAVWALLLTVPYGATVSYGGLAGQLACGRSRMSAQAVGGAVGHNPIALIIPCHRVIGADGRLTGYAGGLERKQALLRLEGISVRT